MKTFAFHNVTIVIAADSAHEAYAQLEAAMAHPAIAQYTSDTYTTPDDDSARDTSELFTSETEE